MQYQAIASPVRRTALRAIIGGVAAITGYFSFSHYYEFLQKSDRFKQIEDQLTKFEPYELKDNDAVAYPWYRETTLKNWEYRLVKIRGYFKEERFFIRRERNGQLGFLVFAPFVTATHKPYTLGSQTKNPPFEYQIWVNLGWVPKENKSDVTMGNDPIQLLDLTELGADNLTNEYTGFNYSLPAGENEGSVLPFSEIVGLVRSGEEQNILFRRRNWKDDLVFTFVDLNYMSRLFRFYNIPSASSAYIERIVPSFEAADEEHLYPIPATIKDFDKPWFTPQRHLDTSIFFGSTSAISLISWLFLLRR